MPTIRGAADLPDFARCMTVFPSSLVSFQQLPHQR
jgi:hypothetical protein